MSESSGHLERVALGRPPRDAAEHLLDAESERRECAAAALVAPLQCGPQQYVTSTASRRRSAVVAGADRRVRAGCAHRGRDRPRRRPRTRTSSTTIAGRRRPRGRRGRRRSRSRTAGGRRSARRPRPGPRPGRSRDDRRHASRARPPCDPRRRATRRLRRTSTAGGRRSRPARKRDRRCGWRARAPGGRGADTRWRTCPHRPRPAAIRTSGRDAPDRYDPANARGPHTVAAVVAPGSHPFELAVACEVFGLDRPELGVPVVPLRRLRPSRRASSSGRSRSRRNTGSTRSPLPTPSSSPRAIPTSAGRPSSSPRCAARTNGRAARRRSAAARSRSRPPARSTAAASTTHWMYAARLAAEYPSIDVQPDVLYVDDGQVLTSAGTSAGDRPLALHRAPGPRQPRSRTTSRAAWSSLRIATAARRSSWSNPCPTRGDADTLGPTLDWIVDNLDRPLTIDEMAAHALMSTRTFMRRFRAAHRHARRCAGCRSNDVAHARRVLESTDVPVDRVAQVSGFGSAGELPRPLPAHRRHRTDLVPARVPQPDLGSREPAAIRAGSGCRSGSSASLIARNAPSSAGDRVRCTQRRLAVPIPCSALIDPCSSATSRSTASVTRSSSGATPVTFTCTLPSPACPNSHTRASGATAATARAHTSEELGQVLGRERDVELVRRPEEVDRLGVRLRGIATAPRRRARPSRPRRLARRRARRRPSATPSVGSARPAASTSTYAP